MSHFAIIIGVDHYDESAWRLTAAVEDALAFRQWALGPGGVPPENVHLLLSPAPGNDPGVPYEPADSEHIIDVIHQFQRGRGADGDRLYFYYAGHGAAAPGAHDEVSLLPADVRSWPRDARRIIGFSEIIPPLQHCGPAAQFFFIDACRDLLLEEFARGAGPVVGRWKGPPSKDAPRRRAQYLLYATSPGGRALETGQGVFGRLLLQGLKGYPGALVWSNRERAYELRFSQLAEYVRIEVEAQVQRLGGAWRQFLQVPEQDIPPGPSGPKDFVLARFSPQEVEKLPLRIRVQPGDVRKLASVSVLYYAPGGLEVPIQRVDPQPPAPLPFPVEVQLPPGDYTVLASSPIREARQPCALYRPQTVELLLDESLEVLDPLLTLGPFRGDPIPHQYMRSPAMASPGMLPSIVTLNSEDPHAQLVCMGPDRQAHTGFGYVAMYNPSAGIYRARLVLPEGRFPEQTFEVHPGGPDAFPLDVPPLPLGEMQLGMLHALGLPMDSFGYSYPSEKLGPVAHLRLASLLGFAAFEVSARTSPSYSEQWLEQFGIPPASIPPGGSGLLVLLGASGSQPMRGSSTPEFLTRSRLVLRDASTGHIVAEGTFEKLSGFGAAAQWGRSVSPGPWILELWLPHLAPTRYALAALRDHRSILVVVANDSGDVEVQQYMAPLPGPERRHTGPAPLGMWELRHVELGQRYLASGEAIPSRHLQPLLREQCLDPVLGCLAGYSFVREGRQELYRSPEQVKFLRTLTPDNASGRTKRSPVQDMLRYFEDLPDAHILAGLCEPEHQAVHFQRALERGPPLFADGLRALQRHAGGATPSWFAEASRGLLPASLWTAWVVS